MNMDFSVQDELPEGAEPAEDEAGASPVAVAKTVGMNSAPKGVPNFKPREPIGVQLPDGRVVGMGQPKQPTSQFLARILKDCEFKDVKMMGQEQLKVRALLYVRDIDGVPVDVPHDELGRIKLEQDLGEDAVDLIFMAFLQCFPPMDDTQLVIIKKS